jgi:hypothetical protein
MKYNLQEYDIEPSGEELHPSNKVDRSSRQDDKQTQPRRSQEAAKTQPRRSQDAAKMQPRRSQDAGTPCHASASATAQKDFIRSVAKLRGEIHDIQLHQRVAYSLQLCL